MGLFNVIVECGARVDIVNNLGNNAVMQFLLPRIQFYTRFNYNVVKEKDLFLQFYPPWLINKLYTYVDLFLGIVKKDFKIKEI